MSKSVERFRIQVPDEVLEDLRQRLARTRWPDEVDNAGWRYGAQVGYLRELMEYWAQGFDWRQQEKEINAFSHYRTRIGDVPIHYIHEPGRGPAPLPLILTQEQIFSSALMRVRRTRRILYINLIRLASLMAFVLIGLNLMDAPGVVLGIGAIAFTLVSPS